MNFSLTKYGRYLTDIFKLIFLNSSYHVMIENHWVKLLWVNKSALVGVRFVAEQATCHHLKQWSWWWLIIITMSEMLQVRLNTSTLQWHHNGRDSVLNHQPHDCLPNRLFRRRSKKTSKLRVTGLCVGNSPVTGEFPTQMASKAENVSIWWRLMITILKQWLKKFALEIIMVTFALFIS